MMQQLSSGPRFLVFDLAGVVGRALLLDEEAPHTCAAIWERLPISGTAGHSMISGTIAGIYLDPVLPLAVENATAAVSTGDVMFSYVSPGIRHGRPEPLSEIIWAYDRYCRPTVAATMVAMTPNVFARIEGSNAAFFEACRRLRDEGRKPLSIHGETN